MPSINQSAGGCGCLGCSFGVSGGVCSLPRRDIYLTITGVGGPFVLAYEVIPSGTFAGHSSWRGLFPVSYTQDGPSPCVPLGFRRLLASIVCNPSTGVARVAIHWLNGGPWPCHWLNVRIGRDKGTGVPLLEPDYIVPPTFSRNTRNLIVSFASCSPLSGAVSLNMPLPSNAVHTGDFSGTITE